MSGEIQAHIRQAVAHERAAFSHKDKYVQQMKAAGSEMYSAFCMAAIAAPERSGRRNEERDLLKLYESNEKRTWWDKELSQVHSIKVKDKRDYAKRLIQWHTDPAAAETRREEKVKTVSHHRSTAKPGHTYAPTREVTPLEAEVAYEAISSATAVDTRESTLPVSSDSILLRDAWTALDATLDRLRGLSRKMGVGAVELMLDDLKPIVRDAEEEVRQAANARFG